ncbi:unnamed protein product [Durusdinium trenchii]|uniref:Uncharacterized protein n=1 Tax=Durusdinium trenchii TaxID=1381693 RepID=A0ABP0QQG9_9DINO
MARIEHAARMEDKRKDDEDCEERQRRREVLGEVRRAQEKVTVPNAQYAILEGDPLDAPVVEVYRTQFFDQSGEKRDLPSWLQKYAEQSLMEQPTADQPWPLLDFDGKDINCYSGDVMDPNHSEICSEKDYESDEDLPLCACPHDSDDADKSQEFGNNWMYTRVFAYGNHVPHLMKADASTAMYGIELFSSVNFILEVAKSDRPTLIFYIFTASFIAVTLTSFVFALVLAVEEMARQIDESDLNKPYKKNEVGAVKCSWKWTKTTFWLTLSYLVLKPRTLVDIIPRIHPRGNCPGKGAAKLFGSRLFYATFLSEAHFKAEDQEGLECMMPLLFLKSGFELLMQLIILSVTPTFDLSSILLLQVAVKIASFMWHLRQWCQLLIIRKHLFAQASGIWLEKRWANDPFPKTFDDLNLEEGMWNYKRKLWEHVFQKHFPHVLGKDLKTCWPSLRFAPGPVTAFCLLLVLIVNTLSAVSMIYFAHFADHKDETQKDVQDLLH